ncbi:MAG: aldehyde dehydrogenase family protein [Gammaproteobacteria bacterium]|nr:aldehyde dehydrogenase family protein [Gammaproteobacteria bacterium]
MSFTSLNPATGKYLGTFEHWSEGQLEQALTRAHRSAGEWAATPVVDRCEAVRAAGQVLKERRDTLAEIISLEMGKLIVEARAEVDKCVTACDYYADHGPGFLADDFMASDAGRSFLAYEPLGPVLAVMPWNFPFWQVMRFAAPALVGGNVALLKHASNVPQCALALEEVFREAGLRDGIFTTLMIGSGEVKGVIEDRRVRAVTLTGSEAAGRAVGSVAGAQLKKTVLELGGSDPFVVLADADLALATEIGLTSRLINAGQSCIAAKRFIVVESVADAFVESLLSAVGRYRCGDPLNEATTLAPLARKDLRDDLHDQVRRSIGQGARPVLGCVPEEGEGAYYPVSILDGVRPDMTAAREELFGPVIPIIRVRDEAEAIRVANDTNFGLGGSVWTADIGRGERVARQIQAGAVFVNGLVKSDPRLPFGGIKDSGYGRELSYLGLHEFLNIKTVWIR